MLSVLRFRLTVNVRWINTGQLKIKNKKNKSLQKKSSESCELKPWPAFIQDRMNIWEELKQRYDIECAARPTKNITITLLDGNQVPGQCWQTTPYEIAQRISPSLAKSSMVAKVNGILWDLDRPLDNDCKLELLKFKHPEGKQVFWRSGAFILGQAIERIYGGLLGCYSPTERGFYCDVFLNERKISSLELPDIDILCKSIITEGQKFERMDMRIEDLMIMFKYNKYKLELLKEMMGASPTATVYKCGPLIELCQGPLMRHTSQIKVIKAIENSSAFWRGNEKADIFYRVYGISFSNTDQLAEWISLEEETKKRDHRKIGREQELFFFHELSPGSCFFQPRGAHIYNTLIDLIKSEYKKHGYQEVITPNIFNNKLWQTSGHWEHYSDNMFSFNIEKEGYSLKPMNCPSHCMIFNVRNRSWRELPLRMADFGVLHRNEPSGSLTGLTRVRRFQQDDAHIFCRINQIEKEVLSCLKFLRNIYEILGFSFDLCLSTRPEKHLGDVAMWDDAEKALSDSLNTFGAPWVINSQDGAFYGPKIDITITDAMKRSHQCATIQLDFQLPNRFKLSFINENGEMEAPVIIHRAIFGSVERMIAILTESYAGKWPFWLSPRQVMVIPVASVFNEYATNVKETLCNAGFLSEMNLDAGLSLNKKIRHAQTAQFNFILIVGEKECSNGTVNMRSRDNIVHGEIKIDVLVEKFRELVETKLLDTNTFKF